MQFLFCLFTLFAVVFSTSCGDEVDVDNYNRMIVYINAKASPASTADILDPNHTAWKALGIHPPEFFPTFDGEAYVFLLNQFGLNFTGVPCSPITGVCTMFNGSVPLIALIPYRLEFPTYRISIDSENTDRGDQGWIIWNYGFIARLLQTGNFQGGVAAGRSFQPGDIISITVKHLLRIGADWSKQKNIELMKSFSPNPAKTAVNAQGFTDQQIFEQIEVCKGKTELYSLAECTGTIGLESVHAHTFLDDVTGGRATITTNVMRFPGTGLRPLP